MLSNSDELTQAFGRVEPLDDDLQKYLEINGGSESWPMIRHPLLYAVPYLKDMNAVYNLQFKQRKVLFDKAIVEGNWSQVLAFTERPYRIETLYRLRSKIKRHELYWEMLAYVYTDTENLWNNEKMVLEMFKDMRPAKYALMTIDERRHLDSLPDKIRVYRGHQTRNRRGMAWTTDVIKAQFFAHRFGNRDGRITSGSVNKRDVYAYFDGRGESEIVTDPFRVHNLSYIGDRFLQHAKEAADAKATSMGDD